MKNIIKKIFKRSPTAIDKLSEPFCGMKEEEYNELNDRLTKEVELDKERFKKYLENIDTSCYKIVLAKELKNGDSIIYDKAIFKIKECGEGYGAFGNFGHYFWVRGGEYFGELQNNFNKPTEFWLDQGQPVIKVIGEFENNLWIK